MIYTQLKLHREKSQRNSLSEKTHSIWKILLEHRHFCISKLCLVSSLILCGWTGKTEEFDMAFEGDCAICLLVYSMHF